MTTTTTTELRRLSLGPVDIAVRERPGSGRTLLFVHGSWDDHHTWDATADALTGGHHLVSYDRRGHSASTDVEGQGTMSDDVADAAALIEAVAGGPVDVVGHSYGACIAIGLAIAHPSLVSSLFLHEPPLFGLLADDEVDRSLADEARRSMAEVVGLIGAGAIEAATRLFFEEVAFGAGSWLGLFDRSARSVAMANVDTWLDQSRDPQRLGLDVRPLVDLDGRITLSQGSTTLPTFAAVCVRVAELVPSASRVMIDGAGHGAPTSHPTELAAAIGRHLEA
ncbi:MAG: alpha/beta hydrolase [Actinomycetota bacterium]